MKDTNDLMPALIAMLKKKNSTCNHTGTLKRLFTQYCNPCRYLLACISNQQDTNRKLWQPAHAAFDLKKSNITGFEIAEHCVAKILQLQRDH